MTERKVLNKYFPPDYDPSKIPRLKRGNKGRQFNIRTMAPFNMRCTTCNGYVYKAKKFNSRMEVAEGVDYLGLRHYRFYIRCPTCCAEIIWRTDLESNDYVIESGAKRNFEALKTAEELEAKRAALEEEELANNPMKLLEKRTNQSKNEMETAEALDDLRELNKRQATVETDAMLLRNLWREMEAEKEAEEKADEELIKELLASKNIPPTHPETLTPVASSSSCSNQQGPSTSPSSTCDRKVACVPRPSKTSYASQIRSAIIRKRPSAPQPTEDQQKKTQPAESPDPTKTIESTSVKSYDTESTASASNLLGLAYSDNSDSD
uniref:Splicing factor YJU2 n=1 Tax=Schistocephalus solidus TaxID=70667 RepID=A0A0X3NMS8_SCHSO